MYMDLKYLCTNIGNLTGIPVRLYDGDERAFFYSTVNLIKDPFSLYEKTAFLAKRHIEYFTTPFFDYYGIVNFGGGRVVIGPTRQMNISEQDIRHLAFDLGIPHYETEDFISSLKNIAKMPLMSLLQLLCTINHVLNGGEKIFLETLAIYEIEQSDLKETLEAEEADRTISKIDEDAETSGIFHNTLSFERAIMNIIARGDVAALKAILSVPPAINSGIIAKDQLRQVQNTFIVTATLASRAAIRGGLNADDALSLSDAYIRKCEMSKSVEAITNLQYRMVIDYTERVEKLRHGGNPSKLVIEVSDYIRHHLSEHITVEKIAGKLYMSRSRLSIKKMI